MSERWSLAFVDTSVGASTVFQAVVDAWMQEIDQKLYVQPPGSLENTEQARDPSVRSAFTAESFLPLRDTLHTLSGAILYPAQQQYYPLWFPSLLSHWNIFEDSHRAARAEIERAVAALERTTDLRIVDDPSSTRIIVLLPRMLKRLSKALTADIAWLLYPRSPSADTVAFQFFAQGRQVDDWFARIADPEFTLIERLRQPLRLKRMLAGRFAWLADYPIAYQDAGETSIRTVICLPGLALSCRLCKDRCQSACSPMTCRSPERVG